MYRVLKLREAETPEAMQKIADKQMPEGGYRYIATHAIGPGTLPKGVEVFKTEDINGGKIAMYISRPLTSDELKQYDIKPEWIQEDEDTDINDLENPDEIKPEEDLEDKISDEIPDEEYMVDPILNELRDVLVDLDWNLFMIGNDDIGPLYIIGRLNDEGIEEMLVEDGESFKFIELPDRIENIMNYNTVYGKPEDEDSRDEAGEDVEIAPEDNLAKGVPHEEIMEFLMNKLVEINPEAAEELKKDKPEEDELPLPEPENNEEGDEE